MSRTKRGVVTRKELCWGANTRIRRKTNDRTIFSPSTPLSRSTALRVRLISIISQKKTIQRRERQFFFLCAQRAKREQEQWFLIEKYPTPRREKKGEPSSAADWKEPENLFLKRIQFFLSLFYCWNQVYRNSVTHTQFAYKKSPPFRASTIFLCVASSSFKKSALVCILGERDNEVKNVYRQAEGSSI